MTETKITKVKYVIQFRNHAIEDWEKSDWNNGISSKFSSNLDYMTQLLRNAREAVVSQKAIGLWVYKEYRLVKQTHSITTEVVDE